jgi:hypothetical protein
MNILACIKAVPDIEMLNMGDWVVIKNLQIGVSFIRLTQNCFEDSIMEKVLK